MHARMPSIRTVSVLTGVVLAATVLSAQDRRRVPADSSRIIVRAWTNGEPLTDLKPADLTIRVDGRAREITALDLVTVPEGGSGVLAGAAPAAPPLPPPYATNAEGPRAASGGREFLILLDDEGIAAGQEDPVRKAVAALVAAASPADRFGVLSTRVGGLSIAATTDRRVITEALAKFVGGGSTTESPLDMTCRAHRAIGMLGNVFRAAPAGRTLVLISPGIGANLDNSGRMMSNTVGSNDPAQTCQVRSNDMEQLGNAAHASPANMYVLFFPEGMANQALASGAQAGLENVAGVSDAEFIRLTSGGIDAVSRIAKETAAYYIATLDGAGGPMRRIEARVNREGAKAVARPAGGPAAPPATTSAKAMQPRDMATTTTKFTDVQLRAVGIVSRQGADDMKVVTMFEPVDPSVKLTAAAVALIEANEKEKASLLTLKSEDLRRSPVLAPQLLKPGNYRIRVAAKTAEGAGGTVDFDVEGALHDAGPLKMSGLMLGVTGAGGFTPKLQFTAADTMAVGVLEVYGVPKDANVTAEFEMLEPDGSQRGAAPGTVGKGPAEDMRMVFGGFDIGTLGAGDYTMRVKVSLDGKLAGTATRTVRKVSP